MTHDVVKQCNFKVNKYSKGKAVQMTPGVI